MLPDKEKGFMLFDRELPQDEAPDERLKHYKEFSTSLPPERITE